MMFERFTDNQRAAATRQGHIIVSAGAGSGKTTVMIARIIDKLIRGAKLENMLIVTFTRAAAADMRIKLSEKLTELKREGKYLREVNEAIEAMSVCNIGTLHSYCQRLIKTYFFAADVDPAAVVCEDGEARLLARAAAESAIENMLEKGDKYFDDMYFALSSRRSADGVTSVITDIMDFALSTPDPEAYLSEVVPDAERIPELESIFAQKRAELCKSIAELKTDLAAAGMAKHFTVIDEFEDYMDGVIDGITSTSHKSAFDRTDELNEQFKALKKQCKAFREKYAEAKAAESVDGAPYVKALNAVAKDALARYAEAKARLGKADYSDLEHGAYRVLADPECMAEIARGVKYVFIDEFQDVNPLQSKIADTFKTAGAEMFVVGDVKQSIYGFRRCSPEHFKKAIASAVPLETAEAAERGGKALSGERYVHIPLTDNFRSAKNVIGFINRVFDRTMTDEFGGADYKNADRLVFGNAANGEGEAEFAVIAADEADDGTDGGTDGEQKDFTPYSVVKGACDSAKTDGEAEFIADSVVAWIERQTELAKAHGAPPPELGSIAVLVRSMNSTFCAALKAEFDKRGVKCSFGRKTSVKSYPSAVALADILRCVDNRLDDVALYTALRSPMGGFSDEELARIAADGDRAIREDGSIKPWRGKTYAFWQKVDAYSGEYCARLDAFTALRDEFIKQSKKLDCADMLGYITSAIDYFQYVYETDGDARAVESLIEYAAAKNCDTHTFLAYYDSADFDLEPECGSDAVNITTVHSSKGLEYDFVIVADTAREFNKRDTVGRVLISENGVAVKIPDVDSRTLQKSVPWLIQNMRAPDTLKQEELRLFYVALTRAKRKLLVCGKNKNGKFDGTVTPPETAVCPLDFMRGMPVSAPAASLKAIGESVEADEESADVEHAVTARMQKAASYAAPSAVPIKTCVTAIAHASALESGEGGDYTETAAVLTVDDRTATEEVVGGAKQVGTDAGLRGSAYHRAMELVDFASPDKAMLERDCENFGLVDFARIQKAAAAMNELAKNATFIGRERYFIADIPAAEIYGEAAMAGESTLVQGVIDLIIADRNGNAVIVDYKTGNVKHIENNAGYRTQLRLYKRAVELASADKFRVVKTYLYSFEADKLIDVDVDTPSNRINFQN